MADQLPTIIGDQGPVEALPVVVFDPYGNVYGSPMTPLGYRQVSLPTGSAVSVQDIPDGARVALVKVEGAAIRYRDDGVAPTAQIGMPLAEGESMTYDATMQNIQVIAVEDGAVINISFYGDLVSGGDNG